MIEKAFKTLSVAEIASLSKTNELRFVQQCSKWLHYFKIDKLELSTENYETALAAFIPKDDLHQKYAVLTSPVIARKLKEVGYTVFESELFDLRDMILIITTSNGFSWVAYKWFKIDVTRLSQLEVIKS